MGSGTSTMKGSGTSTMKKAEMQPLPAVGKTASAADVMADIQTETEGEFGTVEFKMHFKKNGKTISPWHDVPLSLGNGLYNMLTEIPRMTRHKMELSGKEPGNPIMQDEKKGKPRLYHGPIYWNYGCMPQTWESPNHNGGTEVSNCAGDNDPLDCVEIGERALEMGSFTPVKPVGVLSMLDDGELDWKLIVIAASDPHADDIRTVADIDRFYPGTVAGVREWFRWYKTPDGKPKNGFGHAERCLDRKMAIKVIQETHEQYKRLISGQEDAGKLWLPSSPALN